jgi:hypothetical protein
VYEELTAEQAAKWQNDLLKIFQHFDSIKNLTIVYLDLTKWPDDHVTTLFQSHVVVKALVVQSLVARYTEDLKSLIMMNDSLWFLGLGSIYVPSHPKVESTITSRLLPEQSIRLPKLGHLVIFPSAEKSWTDILLTIDPSSLVGLRTLVILCHDNSVVSDMIKASALSLKSLAIGYISEGML